MHTSIDASLNAIQSSRIAEYDFLEKNFKTDFLTEELLPKEIKPSGVEGPRKKINIAAIVAAAIIFLIIIAWFETLRLWIATQFIKPNETLYENATAYSIYAAILTVIGVFILLVLNKYFLRY